MTLIARFTLDRTRFRMKDMTIERNRYFSSETPSMQETNKLL